MSVYHELADILEGNRGKGPMKWDEIQAQFPQKTALVKRYMNMLKNSQIVSWDDSGEVSILKTPPQKTGYLCTRRDEARPKMSVLNVKSWSAATTRQTQVWTAIMQEPRRFTIREVVDRTRRQVPAASVRNILKKMENARYIREKFERTKATQELVFEAIILQTKAPHLHNGKPAKETLTNKMWRSIKMMGVFRLADLERELGVDHRNAGRYVKALHRAGYLIARGTTRRRTFQLRYHKNTGPCAPVLQVRQGARHVWDPNTNEIFDITPKRRSS